MQKPCGTFENWVGKTNHRFAPPNFGWGVEYTLPQTNIAPENGWFED